MSSSSTFPKLALYLYIGAGASLLLLVLMYVAIDNYLYVIPTVLFLLLIVLAVLAQLKIIGATDNSTDTSTGTSTETDTSSDTQTVSGIPNVKSIVFSKDWTIAQKDPDVKFMLTQTDQYDTNASTFSIKNLVIRNATRNLTVDDYQGATWLTDSKKGTSTDAIDPDFWTVQYPPMNALNTMSKEAQAPAGVVQPNSTFIYTFNNEQTVTSIAFDNGHPGDDDVTAPRINTTVLELLDKDGNNLWSVELFAKLATNDHFTFSFV